MIDFKDLYSPESKGNCDICGSPAEGKFNGNELCKSHMTEYVSKGNL